VEYVEEGVLIPGGGSSVGLNPVIQRKPHSSESALLADGTISIRAPRYSCTAKGFKEYLHNVIYF
jgi:hypothetical protein